MDLIKRLNRININDLKEMDWGLAKDWLQSQPGVLINIAMAVVTFFVVSSTYNRNASTMKALGEERTVLQEKSEALEKANSVEKQYKDFVESIPQTIEEDDLIETLSDFAIRRGVRILSFSPAKEESNKFVNVTSVEVNVASADYTNIVLFMHDIENSPYLVRIGNWSGTFVTQENLTQGGSQRSRRLRRSTQYATDESAQQKFIHATIKIESVELKDV